MTVYSTNTRSTFEESINDTTNRAQSLPLFGLTYRTEVDQKLQDEKWI